MDALEHAVRQGLAGALPRDAARERLATIVSAHPADAIVLHGVLAAIARDDGGLAWTSLGALRERLAMLDAQLDDEARTRVAHDAVDAVRWCARAPDEARRARSLAVAWSAMPDVRSVRTARVVDALRSEVTRDGRASVYALLVREGADVRGVLADDAVLDPIARLAVLVAYAERCHARSTLARPGVSNGLARVLTDWTAIARHPRHVVYAYRVALGDGAVDALLAKSVLPVELRAWLASVHRGAPERVACVALGGGRWACARCGDEGVMARGHRGGETEFACPYCALVAFVDTDGDTVPGAWL